MNSDQHQPAYVGAPAPGDAEHRATPDDSPPQTGTSDSPPQAGTSVWLYARSATSHASIEAQLDMLTEATAGHGLAVTGHSNDLGSIRTRGPRAGWDHTVAAVAAGHVSDVVIADLGRLGRNPDSVQHRAAALREAGGRLWVSEPGGVLRQVDLSEALTHIIESTVALQAPPRLAGGLPSVAVNPVHDPAPTTATTTRRHR